MPMNILDLKNSLLLFRNALKVNSGLPLFFLMILYILTARQISRRMMIALGQALGWITLGFFR